MRRRDRQKARSTIRCIKTLTKRGARQDELLVGQKARSAIRCIKTRQSVVGSPGLISCRSESTERHKVH